MFIEASIPIDSSPAHGDPLDHPDRVSFTLNFLFMRVPPTTVSSDLGLQWVYYTGNRCIRELPKLKFNYFKVCSYLKSP